MEFILKNQENLHGMFAGGKISADRFIADKKAEKKFEL
jgi:hypothetical protein